MIRKVRATPGIPYRLEKINFLLIVLAVSLTKTDRKGLPWKQRIIDDVRFCVGKYPNIFVFQVQNMRNNLLKDLRQEWKQNSRFIFGKNRIMQIALGRTKAEEVEKGIHKVKLFI